jgi:hypothetical protein
MEMLEGLCAEMRVRIVEFRFKKVDGTIRVAKGTLKADMLPQTKGGEKPLPDTLQLYYDTEKESFRSFRKENLIDYVIVK